MLNYQRVLVYNYKQAALQLAWRRSARFRELWTPLREVGRKVGRQGWRVGGSFAKKIPAAGFRSTFSILAFYLAFFLGIHSGICCDILSDILPGTSTWHIFVTFLLAFYLVYLEVLCGLGSAGNTLIRSSGLRSGGDHFDAEVAVRAWWGTLFTACSLRSGLTTLTWQVRKIELKYVKFQRPLPTRTMINDLFVHSWTSAKEAPKIDAVIQWQMEWFQQRSRKTRPQPSATRGWKVQSRS